MTLKAKEAVQEQESKVLNELIIDAIRDVKGENIILLDLTKIDDAPTNYFIVCEAESTTKINGIAQNIKRRVRDEMGVAASRIEGSDQSKWILIDFFDTVVHVFYPETRAFYELEDLWSDAYTVEYQDL